MQQNTTSIIISLLLIAILLFIYKKIKLVVIKRYYSPISGKIEIIEKANGEKALTTNNYTHGVSIQHPSIKNSYWYRVAALIVNHCEDKKRPNVLIFGLGANTSSSLVAKLNPSIYQTIVEIDPVIIQANKDYFNLKNISKLRIINQDAYKVINQPELFPYKFDCIVVDIFGYRFPYISKESNQPEFIKKLLPFLKLDGIVIFNTHANNEENKKAGYLLKDFLLTLFSQAEVIEINDKDRRYINNVVVASKK